MTPTYDPGSVIGMKNLLGFNWLMETLSDIHYQVTFSMIAFATNRIAVIIGTIVLVVKYFELILNTIVINMNVISVAWNTIAVHNNTIAVVFYVIIVLEV
jgi:hypothetical protein